MASRTPIGRVLVLTAVAAASAVLAWMVTGWLVEGSILGDAALLLEVCSVFGVLTLCERAFSRIEGPAGH